MKAGQNKPSIILIHGLAGTRQLESCRPVLTPYYHVIIPDLPSNGDTRVPADFDLSVPNVTSQLRTFVETLKIEKICMSLAIL